MTKTSLGSKILTVAKAVIIAELYLYGVYTGFVEVPRKYNIGQGQGYVQGIERSELVAQEQHRLALKDSRLKELTGF